MVYRVREGAVGEVAGKIGPVLEAERERERTERAGLRRKEGRKAIVDVGRQSIIVKV